MENVMPPFPIISVEGDFFECGYQHGEQAKALVAESVENYRNVLKNNLNLDWRQVIRLAEKFLPAINEYDPTVVDEMKGIAEGSGRAFEDILVLNVRNELAFLASSGGNTELDQDSTEGCTVMAAAPEVTESGHMIVGQNVDWLDITQKTYIILKKKRKHAINCVTFLEAGIVGKTGFNGLGIVSFGNALVTDKMGFGVPVQIILNRLLDAHTVSEAIQLFLPPNRGSSVNRLIASKDGLCIDIESAPDSFNHLFPEDGILVHTNHFVIPNPKIHDRNPFVLPNTLIRRHRALQLLGAERGNITKDTFKRIFTDHLDRPNSICMHEDPYRRKGKETVHTVVSVILDLNTLELDIAKGPPCEHEYARIDFSDIRQ